MSVTYSGDNIVFADGSTLASGWTGFKNRIINGDMRIDQRNVGANTTPSTGTFTLDRWEAYSSQSSKFVVARNISAVTPPAGFTNYLGVVSSSAYSVTSTDLFRVSQAIEGFNIADLAWGTAAAAPITISFWVRSSLTGPFGGALQNSANSRAYPFTYTINASNTWEYKTIVVPGETSGVWVTDNGMGLRVQFGLGLGSTKTQPAGLWYSGDANGANGSTSIVGTSGATWFVTGVQVEKGSVASSFDFRPYGTELALCQRYGWKCVSVMGKTSGAYDSYVPFVRLPVTMRAVPTSENASFAVSTGSAGTVTLLGNQTGITNSPDAVWIYNSAGNWTTGANFTLTAFFAAEI